MRSLVKTHARDLYLPWLQQLVDEGDPVDVRGRKTTEFLDCISVVTEPQHHCILIPSRRWNPWIAMSEALWILAGRNDVAALKPYNQNITEFSDDGITLYGAYGARIFDQIDEVIHRLQKDPSDRRAVLQIWGYNQEFINSKGDWIFHNDLNTNSKDPPCNNMVYFKLRDNKLHMTVMCRSNDIHWGLFAVNLPTFGILQEYIAARLGVELGHQIHLSNSLHVYTDDERAVKITNRMLYDEPEDMPKYPSHSVTFAIHEFKDILVHRHFAAMCSDVLDDVPPELGRPLPLFLAFAKMFLQDYKRRELRDYSSFPEFQDWVLAAKIWEEKVWRHE